MRGLPGRGRPRGTWLAAAAGGHGQQTMPATRFAAALLHRDRRQGVQPSMARETAPQVLNGKRCKVHVPSHVATPHRVAADASGKATIPGPPPALEPPSRRGHPGLQRRQPGLRRLLPGPGIGGQRHRGIQLLPPHQVEPPDRRVDARPGNRLGFLAQAPRGAPTPRRRLPRRDRRTIAAARSCHPPPAARPYHRRGAARISCRHDPCYRRRRLHRLQPPCRAGATRTGSDRCGPAGRPGEVAQPGAPPAVPHHPAGAARP